MPEGSVNIEGVSQWLQFVLLIGGVVSLFNGGLYFLFKARFVTKEEASAAAGKIQADLKEHADELAAWKTDHADEHQTLDKAVARIEDRLTVMPTIEQLSKIQVSMADLRGELSAAHADMRGLRDSLKQIEYLAKLTHEQSYRS